MKDLRGKFVIVRGIQSGVYFGILKDVDGQTVEMSDCRNIWRWSGAANLNQIATTGINYLENSKISKSVDTIVFTDICEILICTEDAEKNLRSAKEWIE